MLHRLTEATRQYHAETDADLDDLFRDDVGSSHYLLFLMRLYGFEAPLESALATTPSLDLLLDVRARARAGLLAQDLMQLGLRPSEVAELPLCLTIPQFRGAAEALGWMFVVERATLVHSVLRHHLATRLPHEMSKASAYLSSYAGLVGTRWREYGAAVEQVAHHPTIADRLIDAACEAFRCYRRWVLHGPVSSRLVG
jgi:heme oxygenase